MEKVQTTIIGAGVIGLAIAAELSKVYEDIFIIEKNSSFGQETSSRNSEVIHAGIYYPKDSLKTRTCVEGKRLIYKYCDKYNIRYRKVGKLIVAINNDEVKDLESLLINGLNNGVEDLKILSESEIKKIEPNIKAKAAIHSPSAGILDTHSFMKSMVLEARSRRAAITYNTELTAVNKCNEGFEITVKDEKKEVFNFCTKVLINSAGLFSDKVAGMIGIKDDEYRLKYCKGDYFRVHGFETKLISHLIYPVSKAKKGGLGIHATLDLAGGLRLGPDNEYIKDINYDIIESKRDLFYEGVKNFLPFIKLESLKPDTAGIRAKLQGFDEDFRDFLIRDEAGKGLSGFINLIGIESPGLTGSLSIAKIVAKMVSNAF